MNFDGAFTNLIGIEGGYSNNPRDPGGETKFGISKRSYPNEDIPNLTVDRAKEIYLRDYWKSAGCDLVPEAIKFDLFDMAVNSGVKTATRTLQFAAGTLPDGVIGPKTFDALETMPSDRVVARFNGARLLFMADLTNWPAFGRGWAKRIGNNLLRI